MVDLLLPDDIDRMLCVVAHPDDMEYGASAAVAEWVEAGVEVAYLLLTSGEAGIRHMEPAQVGPLRAQEQRDACRIVGVNDLTILDFPDGLVEPSLSTRAHIAQHIRRFKPQAVMCTTWELETPWGLNHVDHRACGIATVDAIRDADNPWIFPEYIDDSTQPWSTTWLLVTGAPPTHVIGLSRESVEKGISSLQAHTTYLEALPDHPDPRDVVEGASHAGAQAYREAGGGDDVEYALGVRAIRMA